MQKKNEKINLFDIKDPSFLKQLDRKELAQLASSIREFIIEAVSKNGGHLSSNLGVVELTIALHRVFNAPEDKIFFDVGHQCYTHKILTGRAAQFDTLRQFGGLSGFQKRKESIYDCFEAGHSSTALSAAAGMAVARDLAKAKYHVVPVIGDAAMMSGMSFEALNHLGGINNKVIIILNDNEMSISKSIGGFHKWLSNKTTSSRYINTKTRVKSVLKKIPLLGPLLFLMIGFIHRIIKKIFFRPTLFGNLSLGYTGPIDGHNFKSLIKTLENAKNYPNSIVVHVKTQKGKGYSYSEEDKSGQWHGVAPFYKSNGEARNETRPSWSKASANIVKEMMITNEKIVIFTPAMAVGSELEQLFAEFPERCIDGGIAEEHVVTMAAGLALSGLIPIIFIYSSFLQRAYDQILHDIVRMKLKAIFIIDRAGLVGADGETHHGIFDTSFLNQFPDVKIAMAKDYRDLQNLLNIAINESCPFFIRLPRAKVVDNVDSAPLSLGKWNILHNGKSGYLISCGAVLNKLLPVAQEFDLTLIDAIFINELDRQLLSQIDRHKPLFIYDIYSQKSALIDNIINFYHSFENIFYMSLPNKMIEQGKIEQLLENEQISIEYLKKMIKEKCENKS